MHLEEYFRNKIKGCENNRSKKLQIVFVFSTPSHPYRRQDGPAGVGDAEWRLLLTVSIYVPFGERESVQGQRIEFSPWF